MGASHDCYLKSEDDAESCHHGMIVILMEKIMTGVWKVLRKNDLWVRSWRCGCFVTWFCYHLIAKPGNKTAAPSWHDPYIAVICSIFSNILNIQVWHMCISKYTSHWSVDKKEKNLLFNILFLLLFLLILSYYVISQDVWMFYTKNWTLVWKQNSNFCINQVM